MSIKHSIRKRTVSQHTKIGEGSFGCVFKPQYKCKDNKHTLPDGEYVGKVFFRHDDAYDERIIANLLDSFGEKADDYLIIPKQDCIINEEATENIINKCQLYNENLSNILETEHNFIQHIIPYGGKTIKEKLTTEKVLFSDWIDALLNIFKSIHFLNSQGYAHLDLKYNNIVWSDKTRLIDFGFMRKLDDIYNIEGTVNSLYRIYPLEVSVYWLLYRRSLANSDTMKIKIKIEQSITHVINHLNNNDARIFRDFFEHNLHNILKNYFKYRTLPPTRTLKNLLMRILSQDFYDKRVNNAKKIDIYCIGLMCNDVKKYINITDDYKEDKEEYDTFLEGIFHIHYNKRYTTEKAIEHLNSIKKNISS